MVFSVSRRWAMAWLARGAALISAVGICGNSTLGTSQSRPFFITPATPWAYSGLQMISPSAAPIRRRRSTTAAGGVSPSRSGLKCGRSPSPA
jgi:hypothetical protein